MSASFWHSQELSEFIKTADSGVWYDCTTADKLWGQIQQESQHTEWKNTHTYQKEDLIKAQLEEYMFTFHLKF